MNVCRISWCIALTDEQFCALHKNNQALHPQAYDRPRPVKRHWPRTPWDDEPNTQRHPHDES